MSTQEEFVYFPPQDRNAPLILSLAGISYCDGTYAIHRNMCPLIVFEYVERGEGTLRVEENYFRPAAGDVYIAPSWKDHRYASSGENPWVKHWFNLEGPLPEALLSAYGLAGSYHFRNAAVPGSLIMEGVRTLRTLPAQEQVPYMELQLHRIVQALAALRREPAEKTREENAVERIRDYLHRHILKPMPDLASIAFAAGRSPAQTIRIFRRGTGMTPYHYLLKKKMEAASKLLRDSRVRIAGIAQTLGFRDEYYFSRLFSRFQGVSPKKFRDG